MDQSLSATPLGHGRGKFRGSTGDGRLAGDHRRFRITKAQFRQGGGTHRFDAGTVPTIRVYTVRYNPTLDYIQFELDVDWFADAAHGRLVAKIKLASALPSLRVPIHLTDFGLRGRILLGMRLQRMPGVSGVDISFRGVPKVDVSVRPVGLPVADVPGLYQWIMGKIEEVICKKFLEPRRLYATSREIFGQDGGRGLPRTRRHLGV